VRKHLLNLKKVNHFLMNDKKHDSVNFPIFTKTIEVIKQGTAVIRVKFWQKQIHSNAPYESQEIIDDIATKKISRRQDKISVSDCCQIF
jgi:hypothetical protein